MRAAFNGVLTLGLVRIEVKAYPVIVGQDPTTEFHFLHQPCQSRITTQMRCLACGEDPKDKLVRAIQTDKAWLTFTGAELKALEVDSGDERVIHIQQAISNTAIPIILHDKSYYLTPMPSATRAFAVLRYALRRLKAAATVTYAYRGNTVLGLVAEEPSGLLLHSLHFHQSLRECQVTPQVQLLNVEKKAALALLEAFYGEFDHKVYIDTNKQRLLGAIEAKKAGRDVVVPVLTPSHKVISMLSAVKQTVENAKSVLKPQAKTQKGVRSSRARR